MRLWLRDETAKVEQHLKELIGIMAERSAKEIDVLMPGYTHLQVSRIFLFMLRPCC